MPKLLTAKEAAHRIGWTEQELLTSRKRGLPPGALAFMVDGVPMWSSADLIPAPAALTVPELKAEARARGIAGYSSMRREELLEALE